MAKNVKAPSAVAASTVEKKDEKGNKKVRIAYPGIAVGPDGKGTVKLKEWPADFDPRQHVPLLRTDFENEAVWLRRKADEYEKYAKKLRNDADLSEKFGNRDVRAAAKKLQTLQTQAMDLAAQLRAQGIDPSVFLKIPE